MDAIELTGEEVTKLLAAASGDGSLLYLYIKGRGVYDQDRAAADLRMEKSRLFRAESLLRQLGLLEQPETRVLLRSESPAYRESDVSRFLEQDNRFSLLVGEAQRRLGRILSTENLKTLLAIYDYLGLPTEVIGLLIGYCIERSRIRGNANPPNMRAIEKEASVWADAGIDTLERAAGHLQEQLEKLTRFGRFRSALGLGGKLSAGEERYLQSWADMGFEVDAVELAYERTRLATGMLKWPYMNKILTDWNEKNLHTAEQAKTEDQGRSRKGNGSGNKQAVKAGSPGRYEREAVARLQRRKKQEEG